MRALFFGIRKDVCGAHALLPEAVGRSFANTGMQRHKSLPLNNSGHCRMNLRQGNSMIQIESYSETIWLGGSRTSQNQITAMQVGVTTLDWRTTTLHPPSGRAE